ncbi:MAG TPA: tRNA (adenosine(37)-N6)-threonylcarbamoyltransferase complex dimerization subunit type 1 TsaB [Acidimicrobiales bacterium]|nr:tRNA (adenosine(37)-N6)-threonylcarbamoyltransferase complex dimerization subunit type 1 TsaB [Acidimicrobiales bacterium]
MNLLAIETATAAVGVAVLREDGSTVERVHAGGREHAERLVPMVEEACAAAALAVGDLGAVAVDVGPGLFTGLRVGVATAKALAQACGIGVVGIGSLDALAGAAAGSVLSAGRAGVGTMVPVVDARRGEVFAAAYRLDPDAAAAAAAAGPPSGAAASVPEGGRVVDLAPATDDRSEPLSPESLVDWLGELGAAAGPVLVVGDGAVRYLHRVALLPDVDAGLAATLSTPPPAAVARLAALRLAAGARTEDPADLVPDYRRPADARINWEQRAPRRGQAAPR